MYAVKKSKISGSYLIARGVLPLVDISVSNLVSRYRTVGSDEYLNGFV